MIAEGLHRTIGGRERKREEREQVKPEGVLVMPHLGGVAVEKQKEMERAYKKLLGQRLPVVRATNLSAVRDRLAGEFPHAAEQIGLLLSDLVEGEEIRFASPTLFLSSARRWQVAARAAPLRRVEAAVAALRWRRCERQRVRRDAAPLV